MPLNMKILNQLHYRLMNLKMDLFMLDNGNSDLDTEKENNYGKMEVFMKDTGKEIWHTEKED